MTTLALTIASVLADDQAFQLAEPALRPSAALELLGKRQEHIVEGFFLAFGHLAKDGDFTRDHAHACVETVTVVAAVIAAFTIDPKSVQEQLVASCVVLNARLGARIKPSPAVGELSAVEAFGAFVRVLMLCEEASDASKFGPILLALSQRFVDGGMQ